MTQTVSAPPGYLDPQYPLPARPSIYHRAKQRASSAIASALPALGNLGRTVPGLAGMALVATGVSLIYLPAGLIVAGGLLLLIDSRL